jgi:hypothetical protein
MADSPIPYLSAGVRRHYRGSTVATTSSPRCLIPPCDRWPTVAGHLATPQENWGRECLAVSRGHGDDGGAGWGLACLGLAAWARQPPGVHRLRTAHHRSGRFPPRGRRARGRRPPRAPHVVPPSRNPRLRRGMPGGPRRCRRPGPTDRGCASFRCGRRHAQHERNAATPS